METLTSPFGGGIIYTAITHPFYTKPLKSTKEYFQNGNTYLPLWRGI